MCDFKGLFTLKTLWILANITCTGILTVQLIHVLEGYINPTITRTFKEEVPLHDMDFPLVIKVQGGRSCARARGALAEKF